MQPQDAGLSPKALVKPLPHVLNFPPPTSDSSTCSFSLICRDVHNIKRPDFRNGRRPNIRTNQTNKRAGNSLDSFESVIVTGKTFCITICSRSQTGRRLASSWRLKLPAEIKRGHRLPRLRQVAPPETLADAGANPSRGGTRSKVRGLCKRKNAHCLRGADRRRRLRELSLLFSGPALLLLQFSRRQKRAQQEKDAETKERKRQREFLMSSDVRLSSSPRQAIAKGNWK